MSRPIAKRNGTSSTGKRAFRYAVGWLNENSQKNRKKRKYNLSEAYDIWKQHQGRCVFCGLQLNSGEYNTPNGCHLIPYTPFEVGGTTEIWNIVIACTSCKKNYGGSKGVREDIPDLNTFADMISALIKTTLEKKEATDLDKYKLLENKISRLKIMLNLKLTDIAQNMRYKAFVDWMPEEFTIIEENKNSIPDIIENMTEGACGGNEDALASGEEEITQQIKQTMITKKYKIIRDE